MKKIVFLCLMLALFVGLGTSAFADDSLDFDYETAYDWAIEAGFPEDFVDSIDAEYLEKIYNDNIDAVNFEVSYDVQYYYLDENNRLARGYISGSDLVFWLTIAKTTNGDYINTVNVYIYYEWQTEVSARYRDGITVNWDASEWVLQDYSYSASFGITGVGYYGSSSTISRAEQGGIGVYTGTYSDSSCLPYGNISFKLLPRDSQTLNGNRYRSSVTATYAHSTIIVSNITFDANGYSVSISGSYDTIAATGTIYYGV